MGGAATCSSPAAGTITPRRLPATTSTCAIRYLAAWLGGLGCVPIHHLMEDAATAEISAFAGGSGCTTERRQRTTPHGHPIDFALFGRRRPAIDERLRRKGLPGQERDPQAAWMLTELTRRAR